MKEVMIDLECFSSGSLASIIQVGAVYFDSSTGELGKEFNMNVDARKSRGYGFDLDPDTIYWWLSQNKKAQESVCQPGQSIHAVLEKLEVFLRDAEEIWCHATYDFVVLVNAYKLCGFKPYVQFRSARDIRTLTALVGHEHIDREGVHHDALSDAKHQVKYVSKMIQKLKRALNRTEELRNVEQE